MAASDAFDGLWRRADVGRRWLTERVAPRWIDPVRPGSPLFPERMDRTGAKAVCDHRVMVQARHVYAFCVIGEMGWDGPWRARVGAAIDHILAAARRPDGLFVHALRLDGTVADSRADLYDQAFVLFALAHAGRVLGRDDLFAAADALGDALERLWRHPAGGFLEGEIAAVPRRQNPHMHLLEAADALGRASGRARWRDLATEIAALAATRFVDPATGALREYFDEALVPLADERGRIVEPGHCFEWTWLLERLAAIGSADVAVADRLVAFARRHGLDAARGVAINEIMLDGTVRDARARLWPQTERLKAALARLVRLGGEEEAREAIAAFDGLARYFDPQVAGTWTDKSLPEGGFVDEPVPGSSLYHVACAFAELTDWAAGAQP